MNHWFFWHYISSFPFSLAWRWTKNIPTHLSGDDAEATVPRPSQQSMERPSVRIQLAPAVHEDEYWRPSWPISSPFRPHFGEKYIFCGSCFWEKLQFKKDSLEGLDDMCVRYIHWDYVTDCWTIALKLAAGSALCRYLPTVVRCQSVLSQLFHDLWIGPGRRRSESSFSHLRRL